MSRAATVPPTKKLIILRGATDFPGPRKGAARPTDSTISNHFLLRSRQRSIVNDPSVLYGLPPRRFHSTNRSRASLPANNRYVRGLFSPLLLTSSRFVLPSFPFSLSNLHRSTRRFSKIPIFSFSRCIIVDFVSKMLVTSIGCIDSGTVVQRLLRFFSSPEKQGEEKRVNGDQRGTMLMGG